MRRDAVVSVQRHGCNAAIVRAIPRNPTCLIRPYPGSISTCAALVRSARHPRSRRNAPRSYRPVDIEMPKVGSAAITAPIADPQKQIPGRSPCHARLHRHNPWAPGSGRLHEQETPVDFRGHRESRQHRVRSVHPSAMRNRSGHRCVMTLRAREGCDPAAANSDAQPPAMPAPMRMTTVHTRCGRRSRTSSPKGRPRGRSRMLSYAWSPPALSLRATHQRALSTMGPARTVWQRRSLWDQRSAPTGVSQWSVSVAALHLPDRIGRTRPRPAGSRQQEESPPLCAPAIPTLCHHRRRQEWGPGWEPTLASPMLRRSPTAFGRRRPEVRSPSSSGLGHRPFKAAARVRIPLGTRAPPTFSRESGASPGSTPSRPRSAVG